MECLEELSTSRRKSHLFRIDQGAASQQTGTTNNKQDPERSTLLPGRHHREQCRSRAHRHQTSLHPGKGEGEEEEEGSG